MLFTLLIQYQISSFTVLSVNRSKCQWLLLLLLPFLFCHFRCEAILRQSLFGECQVRYISVSQSSVMILLDLIWYRLMAANRFKLKLNIHFYGNECDEDILCCYYSIQVVIKSLLLSKNPSLGDISTDWTLGHFALFVTELLSRMEMMLFSPASNKLPSS